MRECKHVVEIDAGEACTHLGDMVQGAIDGITSAYREGYVAGFEFDKTGVPLHQRWPSSSAADTVRGLRKLLEEIRNNPNNP